MKSRLLSRLILLWSFAVALAALARAQTSDSSQYFFSTFAGAASAGSADGTGAAARFNNPTGCAIDGDGNTYLADSLNKTIRKISSHGSVTTLAGKPGFPGSEDGTGNAARFLSPAGIVVDASGNLFVTDSDNHTIRKISSTGIVTTLAGQAGLAGSTDGSGATARFNHPIGIALDAAGNLYIADQGNYRVRKITSTGIVSTVAGDHEATLGSFDGPVGTAQFGLLTGITIDKAGSVYVTDRSKIRKITPGVDVVTVADFLYIIPPSASFVAELWGLTMDALGNLYTSDPRYNIVGKYSATAGKSLAIVPPQFAVGDPTALVAALDAPHGIAVDQGGNLIVVETSGNTVKKISATRVVSTVAGLSPAESAGSVDDTGAAARFSGPDGLAIGPADELYVADSKNHVIRKITAAGVVTTFAGLAGNPGYVDGTLAAARFSFPRGLAIDTSGNLFVADDGNSVIRKISASGVVTTVAGKPGQPGHTDGPASAAQFDLPDGLAVDALGNIFVAEYGELRRINSSGEVSTLANILPFYNPFAGVATDSSGNLYWSVPDSKLINKLGDPGTAVGTAAIPISTAQSNLHPNKIFVDRLGQIYATSDGYLGATRVHKVAADGSVQTLGGQPNVAGNTDGFGPDALFNGTQGIVVDRAGNIYVSCIGDNTIRKGGRSGPPVISTQPTNQSVSVGGSVHFSVVAAGTPSPTYQWYVGGMPFSGATSNTLSFTNAESSDAGEYTVVVTNALGSVTSNKVTLTVNATPTPPAPATGGSEGGGFIKTGFVLALFGLGMARHLQTPRAQTVGHGVNRPGFESI